MDHGSPSAPRQSGPSSSADPDPLGARLGAGLAALPPAARRVARFVTENRPLALSLSAAELAARTDTSDATVVRTVRALGFEGIPDLKRALAEALATGPAEAMRRTLAESGDKAGNAVDLAIDAQRDAVEALAAPGTRAALHRAVACLHPARRVLVFGVGPSAAVAEYVSTLLTRTGRAARALNASGRALADQLLDLDQGDVLLVLAYGPAYPEVKAVFGEARRLGLPLVLVTDSLDRALASEADVIVPARRARGRRVALHGATLVALEAIVLGLAAADGLGAMTALTRLNDLRAAIGGGRHDVG